MTSSAFTPDWLELLNTGSQPMALAGCTLTDNTDQPDRWAFPTNTVLQPGEFLVLTSAQLGFGFSKLGDSAYLLQLTGTNVLRFPDSVDFPAAGGEEGFGRFQRSDGRVDFTELRATTPGCSQRLAARWPGGR